MPARRTQSRRPDDAKSTIALLLRAYNAELETVMNYLANSVHLDGVRAEEIKKSLAADVTAELGHAQQLARRIKTLGGAVPGSRSLKWMQKSLQPPKQSTNVVAVIKGVIQAEEEAIDMYQQIIQATEGRDYVTQDLAITILGDEENHRREFIGFLKEYQRR